MNMGIDRVKKKVVKIGNRYIGGEYPILIQSMTNTDTRDVSSTVDQIKRLEDVGCDVVRVAIPDEEAAEAVHEIKRRINIPLVADIHFDYRLAIKSIKQGADKIRINPGNIGDISRVKEIVGLAKKSGVSLRVGVNAGSLEKDLLKKHNGVTAEAMVESALGHVKILEDLDYNDIVISLKASNVPMSISAYRLMSQKCEYPLHVGITEAGTLKSGIIKSAVGIGAILSEGIGDTIRVSLTGDPTEEILAGIQILKALGHRKEGVELISCPTCGRCQVDLITIAEEVEKRLTKVKKNIKVAVMGCAVNGPGEAREADIGIAGGKNEVLLFKRGEVIRKIPQDRVIEELIDEINNI